MKYYHTMQDLTSDCGIAVVKSILLTYGKYDEGLLSDRVQNLNINQGLSLLDIEGLLSNFGIYGSNYQVDKFTNLDFQNPSILVTKREGLNHYILVYGRLNDKLVISNPAEKDICYKSIEEVRDIFNGFAYIVERNDPKIVLKETSQASQNNKDFSFKEKVELFFMTSLLWIIPLFIIFSIQYLIVYQARNMSLFYIILSTIIYILVVLFFFIAKMRLDDLNQKISFRSRLIQVNKFMENVNNKKIDREYNIYNDLIKFWNNFYAADYKVKILTIKYDLFYLGILFCLIFLLNKLIAFLTLGFLGGYFFVFILTKTNRRKANKAYVSNIGELSNFIEEFMHNKIDRFIFSNKDEVNKYSLKLLRKIDISDREQRKETTKALGIYDTFIYFELTFLFFYVLLSIYFSFEVSVLSTLICFALVYIMFNLARPTIQKLLDIEKYSLNEVDYQLEKDERSLFWSDVIERIALKNVTFSFDDEEKKLLHNLTAVFENKQLSVIKGQNGSGKTTLLHLIMGIEKVNEGNITYLSKSGEVYDSSQFNLLNQVSYYSSDEYLNYTSTEKNILYTIYSDELGKQLKNYFNVDLNKVIFYNGENLSLGERQKILLTRCLNKQANIYIFDEPCTNLDIDSKNKFYELIEFLKQNSIVIIVAHDNQFDKLANQIIELN